MVLPPEGSGGGGRGHGDGAGPGAPRTALFQYFTDVKEADLARIAEAGSRDEVRQALKECMQVDEEKGFRTEILADLHYHNYTFCLSLGFAPAKTSTLLSISKVVLHEAVSKKLDAAGAFDTFKQLLLKHGVERPPWSVGIFSFDDVKAIMAHVHGTFFRHFRLYMYAFVTHCDLDFHAGSPVVTVAAPTMRPVRLCLDDEVDPRSQPELAHLFKPSEVEQAEAELRKIRGEGGGDDRAERVKQHVESGVQKLMEQFEGKLKEQDEKYLPLLGG